MVAFSHRQGLQLFIKMVKDNFSPTNQANRFSKSQAVVLQGTASTKLRCVCAVINPEVVKMFFWRLSNYTYIFVVRMNNS